MRECLYNVLEKLQQSVKEYCETTGAANMTISLRKKVRVRCSLRAVDGDGDNREFRGRYRCSFEIEASILEVVVLIAEQGIYYSLITLDIHSPQKTD